MNLKSVGYYTETNHGIYNGLSIHDIINLADPELIPQICEYLDSGIPLIVSPGCSEDVFDSTIHIPAGDNAYTDGFWIWPGDLSYYVSKYRLQIPDDFLQTMIRNNWTVPITEDCILDKPLYIDGICVNSGAGPVPCPECGTEMQPIDPTKYYGMICPNCGWGWATSDPGTDL